MPTKRQHGIQPVLLVLGNFYGIFRQILYFVLNYFIAATDYKINLYVVKMMTIVHFRVEKVLQQLNFPQYKNLILLLSTVVIMILFLLLLSRERTRLSCFHTVEPIHN